MRLLFASICNMRKTTYFTALFVIALPATAYAQQSTAEEAVEAVIEAASQAVDETAAASYKNDEPRFKGYIEPRFVQIDYPVESVLAGQEARVEFRVDVDRDGNATACEVTGPSEFERLNEETCPHVLRRGAFIAGEDDEGNPVAGTLVDRVYWRIREPDMDAFSIRFAFTQTETGEMIDCELISFSGAAPQGLETSDPCRGFGSETTLYRDEHGAPVRKRLEVTFDVKVSDLVSDAE